MDRRQGKSRQHRAAEIERTQRRNAGPGSRETRRHSRLPQPQQGNESEQQADDSRQQAQRREQESDAEWPDTHASAEPAQHGQYDCEHAKRQRGDRKPASFGCILIHIDLPRRLRARHASPPQNHRALVHSIPRRPRGNLMAFAVPGSSPRGEWLHAAGALRPWSSALLP